MATTGNTWLNALIGAVATFLLSFTMVSPVLGGALAGYLERGDGVRVGALSGLIAALPLVLLAFLLLGLLSVGGGPPLAGFFVFVVAVIFLPAYTIALSALGGYLGVYLRDEL